MIRWLLIACGLLCFQGDEVTMSWNAERKLVWTDFQDKPNPNIDAVALTASGITFGYSISKSDNQVQDFKTHVHAHFYPEKSWFKPESANAYILSHEQLHFDITELHARKFRQGIAALSVNSNIKKQLDALHDIINKQLAIMQDNYDNESDFSRIPEQQLKWQNFVAEELKKLEAYKSK